MVTTVPITENGFTLWPEKSSLARLRYFFGQLLTQRDLEVEQRYHLALQRMMQREAFGTGTTAGLRVVREKDSVLPPLGVFVQPGLAFDPDGRELVLESEECIDVAVAPVAPGTNTVTGGDKIAVANSVESVFGQGFEVVDLDAVAIALTACGLMTQAQLDAYNGGTMAVIVGLINQIPASTPTLDPPALLRDWIIGQLVGITYVGLRYRELGSDPSPAVLDASCCGDVTCFPTRTSQGVFIVTSQEPFPEIADRYTQVKECLDTQFFKELDVASPPDHVDVYAALCECLTSSEAWKGVPPVDDPCNTLALPTICIARVCWRKFTSGTDDNILTIDNCGCRKLAPGGPTIRALLESLTGNAAPANLLPRIVAIEPLEGAEITIAAASTLNLRATVDATIETTGVIANAWELVFYPAAGGIAQTFNDTLGGPGGGTGTITFQDAGPTSGRMVQIAFSGGTGWSTGTYVWRLPIGGVPLESTSNSQPLDAEPNPPTGVPSGDGLGGGTFEARFVVIPNPT